MIGSRYLVDVSLSGRGDPTKPGQGMVRCRRKRGDEIAIVRCVLQQAELCVGCAYHITEKILENPKLAFQYQFSSRCERADHVRAKGANFCAFCFIYDQIDVPMDAMSEEMVKQAKKKAKGKRGREKKIDNHEKSEQISAALARELKKVEKKKEQQAMAKKEEKKRLSNDAEILAMLDILEHRCKKSKEILDGYRDAFDQIVAQTRTVMAANESLRKKNKNLESLVANHQEAEQKYLNQLATLREDNEQLRQDNVEWHRLVKKMQVQLGEREIDPAIKGESEKNKWDTPLGQWSLRAFHSLSFLTQQAGDSRLQNRMDLPFSVRFLVELIRDFPDNVEDPNDPRI